MHWVQGEIYGTQRNKRNMLNEGQKDLASRAPGTVAPTGRLSRMRLPSFLTRKPGFILEGRGVWRLVLSIQPTASTVTAEAGQQTLQLQESLAAGVLYGIQVLPATCIHVRRRRQSKGDGGCLATASAAVFPGSTIRSPGSFWRSSQWRSSQCPLLGSEGEEGICGMKRQGRASVFCVCGHRPSRPVPALMSHMLSPESQRAQSVPESHGAAASWLLSPAGGRVCYVEASNPCIKFLSVRNSWSDSSICSGTPTEPSFGMRVDCRQPALQGKNLGLALLSWSCLEPPRTWSHLKWDTANPWHAMAKQLPQLSFVVTWNEILMEYEVWGAIHLLPWTSPGGGCLFSLQCEADKLGLLRT